MSLKYLLGSGCDTVGRKVASYARDPHFESRHWQYCLRLTVLKSCTEKTEIKRPGMVEFEKCVPRQSFQKCLFLLWTPKIFSWQDGDDAKLLILSPTFKVRFGPLSLWSAENENETTILNQKLFSFSPLLLALVLYFTPFLIFKSLSFNLNLSLSFTLILPIHFVCLFHFLTSLIHSQIRDIFVCSLSLSFCFIKSLKAHSH